MSESRGALVWLNGGLAPAATARVDPADRGFTLGDGLFETILVSGGVPRHAGLHLARLRAGAALLDIRIPFADADILSALTETLAANSLSEAVLRVTLTRGPAARGLVPGGDAPATLLITAAAFVEAAPTCTAVIARSTRRNERSPLAGLKSLNYLDNIIARREALRRGADDAILLNTRDDVAEATAANLFLLKDGKWLTPRLQDGALPGILRGRLLAGGDAAECRLTEQQLVAADAICLGNALSVRALTALDGRPLQPAAAAADEIRRILRA